MAIVLKTWGEQLEEVQTAISTVLLNQRYEINGRMVQRADLEYLHKREVYLLGKFEEEGDVLPSGGVPKRGVCAIEFH